nr:MAG TPA: hypothetical protein [Caudoviricetes sp.]
MRPQIGQKFGYHTLFSPSSDSIKIVPFSSAPITRSLCIPP